MSKHRLVTVLRSRINYPFGLPFCSLAASLNYRTKAMRIRRSLPGNKIAKPTGQFIRLLMLCCFGLVACTAPYSFPEPQQQSVAAKKSPAVSKKPPAQGVESRAITPSPSLPPEPKLTPMNFEELRRQLTAQPLLNPGDTINIQIDGEEGLSKQLCIPADGAVYYPVIKQIKLSGKTVKELTQEFQQRLTRYLVTPIVNISIVQRAQRVVYLYIDGQGSRAISLPANQTPTASRVLLATELPADLALDDISIVRQRSDGQSRVHRFSLKKILTNYDFKQDFLLEPNDLILVKKQPRIYIQGSVVNPGNIVIAKDQEKSLWEVLALVGGPTLTADLDHIKIYRKTSRNTREQLMVSAAIGDSKHITFIKPEDIIIVPAKAQTICYGVWRSQSSGNDSIIGRAYPYIGDSGRQWWPDRIRFQPHYHLPSFRRWQDPKISGQL